MGEKTDDEPFLRLWDAAFDDDEMKASMLLAMGEDVNQQDPDTGSTPLFIAAQCGNVKVINVLINDGGADVNLAKKDGATPLCAASQYGKIDAALALIEAGAETEIPRDGDVAPPLHIAVVKNNLEMAVTLVEAGVNINQRWKEGVTPLFVAAKFGYAEMVRLLIKLGANINAASKKEVGPPTDASSMAEEERPGLGAVSAMFEFRMPASYKGGATPICAAAQFGQDMVVNILEKAGADRRPAEKLGFL